MQGVTGAGKTTLLDVLANRANFGVARGEICIDGQKRDESFQRKIGYAQQEDIHLPTATVREALEFSALMRQPAGSQEDKLSYVDNVIEILDMKSYAEAIVGVPGDGETIHCAPCVNANVHTQVSTSSNANDLPSVSNLWPSQSCFCSLVSLLFTSCNCCITN